MANLKEVRTRIASVSSTQQITSAMKMVSAAKFRRLLGMNKQTYGKFVKCDTVESKLSGHRNEEIDFSKLPSLALLKYWARFAGTSKNNPNTDMAERFQTYLDSVKKGENKMNMNTASVYDIYRNADKINADIAFAQIEKISGSWLPIVDTSASMFWESSNDAISKALAVAHYLAKCSTYAPNKVVSFSSWPKLIELGMTPSSDLSYKLPKENGTMYNREIRSMYTGDCSNTNFGAVMKRMFEGKGASNFTPDGYLTIGFVGSHPNVADWYTNNGSLYMTSLAFMPLGLPADDPFWTDAPEKWTSKKAWEGDDFPKDHKWDINRQILYWE